jgi:uncharacterized membrane protein
MNRTELWVAIPEPIRRLPADLAAVLVLTVLTLGAVFLPVVNETPLRVVFGLPFVLFLPGYAFIAALFPEAGEAPTSEEDGDGLGSAGNRDRGIDGIERVALSFGLSIAIVPLIGLVLNFTPWGIRLVPIAIAVSGTTILAAAVGAVQRWELPEDERFTVPYRDWIDAGRTELFEPDSRTDAVLNVVLALSILLAVSSVAYAVAVPPQGEQFSEFYLLTEDDDGELVADGYPEEFVVGEGQPVVVGIGNNEHERTEYQVVAQLQTVETVGNETVVQERERIDSFEIALDHNETHNDARLIVPDRTGEDLRVQYLLYRDEVPAEPTAENAYRDVHLWIDVFESEPES